ncbi:MAG: glycosyltransferase family 1 protein [Actinobacteria bacterium]|nr:glycosyltransferase family 1 protein [Actinomycetota bacterium]
MRERCRQTRRLLAVEGASGVVDRLRERAAERLAPNRRLPVAREHLVRAAEIAAAGWELPEPAPHMLGDPLTIAWISVPPSPSSGGHTTMFRMIAELELAGHVCVLYLHDRHGWELAQHERAIRSWLPHIRAEIRDVADGIDDSHVIMATSWDTAYPALASPARGARCYFVADFEPSFYAAGSEALLAEATYRFGFYGVTLGRWLAELVRRQYGMEAEYFEFACDLDTYALDVRPERPPRTGVCYYCRPSTPRRAHELAVATLDLFAADHPEVDVHVYGEPAGRLPFAATHHGFIDPRQLAELYNRCIAGLALSATNVSLVPHEMLGCGCIPVVNDAEHNRVVLDNAHVAYAPATPFELANALDALVERPAGEREEAALAAALSVTGKTWAQAGAECERILRGVVASRSGRAVGA